ncbi:hypothetical protein [Actinophytocola gossypii]|uniref:AbiTii domain-containing protein n=1 Tax=Actinophytocola gossypii TaxID=2812003 RepID=A0ABT2JKH7_9PSEU|nr:hypothetical protein [Actinophytocola gossypii]MCT2588258.1 hypothetical protein [Actinophytocola gossypii]
MAFEDQLDQTVERIIDEAIDFYMYCLGWTRHGGNYMNELMHGWEITPPVNPSRRSGGLCLYNGQPEHYAFEYGEGTNAASFVYAHFEDTIRDVFECWRSIPDPKEFEPHLDNLLNGAWFISLTTQGDKLSEIGNIEMEKIKTLQSRIGNDDMGGTMILTFEQNFVTPLPAVIHGQYAVVVLVATTLLAEQRIWAKAREDVLSIAEKTHAAMKERGTANVFDLGTITAFIDLLGMLPTGAKPILNKVGEALGPLATLLGIKDSPSKPPVEFAGDWPKDVIDKTNAALRKLAEIIKGRERVIDRQIKEAMRTVVSRSGSFDLPKPEVLSETQIDGMAVNLETLKFLATNTLPVIESQLNKAADLVNASRYVGGHWYRRAELNTWDTEYGPYDTWSALADLAEGLITDLAWEVKESATHLSLAADDLGRTEAEVEASMVKHAEQLGGGSGHTPIKDANDWLESGQ